MPVTQSWRVIWTPNQTGAHDLGGPTFAPVLNSEIALFDGVLANQSDVIFADKRNIAASSNDDLDLNGTALKDAFGANIAALKVVAIYIQSAIANLSVLTIGNGATPFIGPFGAAAHTVKLNPGGIFMMCDPSLAGLGTVTPATADILRVANGAGGPADYTIILSLRSA